MMYCPLWVTDMFAVELCYQSPRHKDKLGMNTQYYLSVNKVNNFHISVRLGMCLTWALIRRQYVLYIFVLLVKANSWLTDLINDQTKLRTWTAEILNRNSFYNRDKNKETILRHSHGSIRSNQWVIIIYAKLNRQNYFLCDAEFLEPYRELRSY